jgi:PrgI family protein
MQRPPVRINIMERTLFGLTYRQIAWLTGSGLVAMVLFLNLSVLDLVARGILAVLLFGLGAAVAFGLIDGQVPEVWLFHCLAYSRRGRFLVKGARRQEDGQAVLAEDAGAPPVAAAAPAAAVAVAASIAAKPSTFPGLSVSAVAASLLVGLTLYLYSGGAERLSTLIWHGRF